MSCMLMYVYALLRNVVTILVNAFNFTIKSCFPNVHLHAAAVRSFSGFSIKAKEKSGYGCLFSGAAIEDKDGCLSHAFHECLTDVCMTGRDVYNVVLAQLR